MNGKTKATLWDIGKGTVANLSAFIIAAAATATAWTSLGGPLPASDQRVAQLEQQVNETQATYLADKLLDYRRELRGLIRQIQAYERRGESPPQNLLNWRDTLERQIYTTERRLKKLGVQP